MAGKIRPVAVISCMTDLFAKVVQLLRAGRTCPRRNKLESSATTAVHAFIAAINRGDTAQMSELMTEDHTFVDSGGTVESGRSNITKGWNEYFQMFPDFRVEVECMLQDGNLVAAFGKASGTYDGKRGLVPENRIEMPAAWKAIVKNGKIKFWQVYADWSEGGRIIAEDEQHG